MSETTTFRPGKTYDCLWPTDSSMRTPFRVASRTAQFVTLERVDGGEIVRCKVKTSSGSEYCLPFGSFSMAPVLRSTREAVSC